MKNNNTNINKAAEDFTVIINNEEQTWTEEEIMDFLGMRWGE